MWVWIWPVSFYKWVIPEAGVTPIIKAAKSMMALCPRKKKGVSGAHGREELPLSQDPVKAESAAIFYKVWQQVKEDKQYLAAKAKHKEQYEL